jgi:hypothetical protein
MNKNKELRLRVEAKVQHIKAEIADMHASAEGSKNDAIATMETKLAQVNEFIHHGWDSLTEDASTKINEWLK